MLLHSHLIGMNVDWVKKQEKGCSAPFMSLANREDLLAFTHRPRVGIDTIPTAAAFWVLLRSYLRASFTTVLISHTKRHVAKSPRTPLHWDNSQA
jgi:hypothetical protein